MNKTLDKNRQMKDSEVEWIGYIPENWNIVNIKFIFSSITEKNKFLQSQNVLSLVKDIGVIPYSEKGDIGNKCSEDITRYNLVRPNDIVMNSMNVIIGSVGKSKYIGVVSPVYYVLRVRDEQNSFVNYYENVFKTRMFQQSLKGYGNGILEHRMRIPIHNLNKVNIPLPHLNEQQAIANYLDEQVLKIDELIAEQKQAIQSWKAYKESLITEKVTKGLSQSIEMKESGIEWIGEIPKGWKVIPNKYVMKKVKNICLKYENEDILSLTINGVISRDLDNPLGKMPNTFDGYQRLRKGNLLMCLFDIDVTPRCIGLINNNGLTSPAYSQFTLKNNNIAKYYYYYYLSLDFTKELLHISKNLRNSITETILGGVRVPLPPLHEQQAIANYLDEKCSKIDELIEQKQVFIKQLEEYKQSLIYECVTGKRCVL